MLILTVRCFAHDAHQEMVPPAEKDGEDGDKVRFLTVLSRLKNAIISAAMSCLCGSASNDGCRSAHRGLEHRTWRWISSPTLEGKLERRRRRRSALRCVRVLAGLHEGWEQYVLFHDQRCFTGDD